MAANKSILTPLKLGIHPVRRSITYANVLCGGTTSQQDALVSEPPPLPSRVSQK